MAVKILKLPLFNDTYYSYPISLEGNTYVLDFLFLERINDWTLSLKDSEQNPLVLGQRMTPDTELFFSYQVEGLSGYFLFTPISVIKPSEVSDNIQRPKDFYNLFYIYDDGE